MTISRNTYDPSKKYHRIQFHQDRDLLDSELNELQDLIAEQHRSIAGLVLRDGAVIAGLQGTVRDYDRADVIVDVSPGIVYIAGLVHPVAGVHGLQILTPGRAEAIVWAEALRQTISLSHDEELINPATGEATAEREKWVVSLKPENTQSQPLPPGFVERIAVPVLYVEKRSERITPVVNPRSQLRLDDFMGTLDGSRITVGSISENQLSFAAAEGLHTLLDNLAERTYDESGSYIVRGLDSFVGNNNGTDVDVVTNSGRAYIRGYRFQLDVPRTTKVPKSVATRSVRGEQKTFNTWVRRYPLSSQPLETTTQVEGIVETSAAVTRGSVMGGQDTLSPGPVVNIIDVRQGATIYRKGIDWQQVGNTIDWLTGGVEPAIGTTYTARWTYTRQMVKNTDYVDGGWFGAPGYPPAGDHYYIVLAFKMDWDAVEQEGELRDIFYDEKEIYVEGGVTKVRSRFGMWAEVPDYYRVEEMRPLLAESWFNEQAVAILSVPANGIVRLEWKPVNSADGYRVFRASGDADPYDFSNYEMIRDVGNCLVYTDDGADPAYGNSSGNAPSSPLDPPALTGAIADRSLINFGRTNHGVNPVHGTNLSVDYRYFLGRRDLLCVTTREILRIQGSPSEDPKLPQAPEGTMPLCALECPANSVALKLTNLGLTRVTMQQLHMLLRDVEALKYNDAQFQQLLVLQNRDAAAKKGIYTDNFSNDSQSDTTHPLWNARIDKLQRFVAPNRVTRAHGFRIDVARSTYKQTASLAMLPATEVVLEDQPEWSETRPINLSARFGKPRAEIRVTPNICRIGWTTVTVTGHYFTPGASNITIRCDGFVVASNVSTDAQGRFTRTILLSSFWRWGYRVLEASDGVNTAQANLKVHDIYWLYRIERYTFEEDGYARAIREPVHDLIWNLQRRPMRFEPLAQTFRFEVDRVLSAIGLFFGQKDPTLPITVQIRGVTAGVPNETVLAQRTLSPGEVVLGAETKVTFDNPFHADANTSYAVVLMTQSRFYAVRVATLGQMGQEGLITSQVYSPGVLLESTNNETWTALQSSDLMMKIYGYNFAPQGEVRFQVYSGAAFSSFNLDEFSIQPLGTSLRWEYSTDDGVNWQAFEPGAEELLPASRTTLWVRALMTSSRSNETPVLNFHDVHWLGYLSNTTGSYVTRELALVQGVVSAKVYTVMSVPSGTTVTWFASNNGGQTWEAMTLEGTRAMNQTWTEYTLSRTFTSPTGNRIRFRAAMTGSNLLSPRIHSLGATLT